MTVGERGNGVGRLGNHAAGVASPSTGLQAILTSQWTWIAVAFVVYMLVQSYVGFQFGSDEGLYLALATQIARTGTIDPATWHTSHAIVYAAVFDLVGRNFLLLKAIFVLTAFFSYFLFFRYLDRVYGLRGYAPSLALLSSAYHLYPILGHYSLPLFAAMAGYVGWSDLMERTGKVRAKDYGTAVAVGAGMALAILANVAIGVAALVLILLKLLVTRGSRYALFAGTVVATAVGLLFLAYLGLDYHVARTGGGHALHASVAIQRTIEILEFVGVGIAIAIAIVACARLVGTRWAYRLIAAALVLFSVFSVLRLAAGLLRLSCSTGLYSVVGCYDTLHVAGVASHLFVVAVALAFVLFARALGLMPAWHPGSGEAPVPADADAAVPRSSWRWAFNTRAGLVLQAFVFVSGIQFAPMLGSLSPLTIGFVWLACFWAAACVWLAVQVFQVRAIGWTFRLVVLLLVVVMGSVGVFYNHPYPVTAFQRHKVFETEGPLAFTFVTPEIQTFMSALRKAYSADQCEKGAFLITDYFSGVFYLLDHPPTRGLAVNRAMVYFNEPEFIATLTGDGRWCVLHGSYAETIGHLDAGGEDPRRALLSVLKDRATTATPLPPPDPLIFRDFTLYSNR